MKKRTEIFAKIEKGNMPLDAILKNERFDDLVFSNYHLREKEKENEQTCVIHFSDKKADSVVIHDMDKNVFQVMNTGDVENLFVK